MLNGMIFTICFLFVLFMPTAHAYIDPGTGTMLLQVLAACGVAVLVFGKNLVGWVRGFFVKNNPNSGSGNEK